MTDTLDTRSADYVRAVAERPAGILPGALVGTYLHGSAVLGVSAAARYLSGSSFKGKVALTGLGTPNQMRKFVKYGTVESFELWDPGKLGYLAAYAAAALASGQITGKQGETFKAGNLGIKTIGADGEILLGPCGRPRRSSAYHDQRWHERKQVGTMTDPVTVKDALRQQRIELPSWAFGNSGTRFKVFAQPGVPRSAYEKLEDAARVHAHTGVAPSVALHIPWDAVEDYADLAKHAADHGVQVGTINANVFQDDDYKLGSVANPDPRVRRKALDHLLACVDVMDATGSRDLKLWFADGTNYPGQDSIRARQERLAEALAEVYQRLGSDQRMLLEYKLFEPAFYSTDVPDWGTAYAHCLALGERALVVVDTGHHAPGTNIEMIVALLLRAGRLGGFDFNSRFYADDDLMVGAADPFQLFRIMHEVVQGGGYAPEAGIAFMLDQCHNIEPKIPGQIRSVMNVQEATAKALLVDLVALEAVQRAGDVLGANAVLMDAYSTDVRPLLAELRTGLGLDPDPMAAYARSGYGKRIVAERVGGNQAGWGA
jgi:L-rhamnose isomerase/sugar isomerase